MQIVEELSELDRQVEKLREKFGKRFKAYYDKLVKRSAAITKAQDRLVVEQNTINFDLADVNRALIETGVDA